MQAREPGLLSLKRLRLMNNLNEASQTQCVFARPWDSRITFEHLAEAKSNSVITPYPSTNNGE